MPRDIELRCWRFRISNTKARQLRRLDGTCQSARLVSGLMFTHRGGAKTCVGGTCLSVHTTPIHPGAHSSPLRVPLRADRALCSDFDQHSHCRCLKSITSHILTPLSLVTKLEPGDRLSGPLTLQSTPTSACCCCRDRTPLFPQSLRLPGAGYYDACVCALQGTPRGM